MRRQNNQKIPMSEEVSLESAFLYQKLLVVLVNHHSTYLAWREITRIPLCSNPIRGKYCVTQDSLHIIHRQLKSRAKDRKGSSTLSKLSHFTRK